jgi:hypothetical protein
MKRILLRGRMIRIGMLGLGGLCTLGCPKAVAADSASIASMGMDTGDFLNEGRPGLFTADWSKRPDLLWRQDANAFFTEIFTS